MVAGHVLRQQQEVVILLVLLHVAAAHGALPERLVGLDADEGADAGVAAGAEELDGAVHDAVVGEGQGGLAQAHGLLDQALDAPQPVEQRIFGVDVQVDEVVGHGVGHTTGVSQPCWSGSSPSTMPKKRAWIRSVMGPRLPLPTFMRSTERTGVISTAVPVKKISSAM